jgi:ParB-like chromosome segregation protein Spo0J
MCASIREFGFKIPVLARSDGTVVDGHLRIKAARKLGSWPGGDTTGIPVILCEEWTDAQVKAFRLMVNRSVTWADWDDELLSLELQELAAADFDLSLTGFDPRELEDLLTLPDNGHSVALSTTVNSFILNPLMGNIGSHEDLTSERQGQQAKEPDSRCHAASSLPRQPA